MAGLEPATFGLEVRRAIQLRHTGSSGNRFRSYDLRVMGPTRFLCATPLHSFTTLLPSSTWGRTKDLTVNSRAL